MKNRLSPLKNKRLIIQLFISNININNPYDISILKCCDILIQL